MDYVYVPPDASVVKHLHEKELKWKEKLEVVDLLTDGLGLKVDEGVKETLIALSVFDINTTASHEGKIDRYPVPYIDVRGSDIYKLEDRLWVLKDKTDKESVQESDALIHEICQRNLIERNKIAPLLEEFNTQRDVPNEIRLGIASMARGWTRVQSQGAVLQENEIDEQIRKLRLQQFQKEMKDFTDFLKNKYFNS